MPDSLVDQQHRAGEFDPAEVPLDEKNLAYRAAVAMVQAHGLTVNDLNLHLHIDKAVPVAGGMAVVRQMPPPRFLRSTSIFTRSG